MVPAAEPLPEQAASEEVKSAERMIIARLVHIPGLYRQGRLRLGSVLGLPNLERHTVHPGCRVDFTKQPLGLVENLL